MKGISIATKIIAKICEVVHWIGMGGMICLAVVTGLGKTWLEKALVEGTAELEATVSTYGFEVGILDASGAVSLTALLVFAIGAALILGLMAMVFRNIYLILKKSENTTPFQKDNVRMVREIGIFAIAIPVLGLIFSGIARLAVGAELLETSVNMDSLVYGLAILCLSQFFARGVELEQDVGGLL